MLTYNIMESYQTKYTSCKQSHMSMFSPCITQPLFARHPTPAPTHQIHFASHADHITIASTHHKHKRATAQAQQYIYTMSQNRLKVKTTKSSITLPRNDTTEQPSHTTYTINNTPMHPWQTHAHTQHKILGVTYNTTMSFAPHITDTTENVTKD
jgi:hypothetical protein